MGNVNMEARQIHVRDNNKKTWRTVADALKALEASGKGVAEDITELYTRDASRASKDDIANEFSAEQAYYAGDYVYYQGSLFKFVANHAAGEWSSEDVVIAQIGPAIANAGAVDYSTTEQPTGQKWIDGSEIYVKTEVHDIPSNVAAGIFKFTDTAFPTDINVLKDEIVVEMFGALSPGLYAPWYTQGSVLYSGIDSTGLGVYFGGNHYAGGKVYVTLYYTKSV